MIEFINEYSGILMTVGTGLITGVIVYLKGDDNPGNNKYIPVLTQLLNLLKGRVKKK